MENKSDNGKTGRFSNNFELLAQSKKSDSGRFALLFTLPTLKLNDNKESLSKWE
jgi:hypothetical protein